MWPKNRESSSGIVKIRNLDTVRIVTEYMSGQIKEQDLTNEYDTDTEKGLEKMRKKLENLTDIASEESRLYRSVDVGFPIPFLKVNLFKTKEAV